jgi:cytidylate kinase-like protein
MSRGPYHGSSSAAPGLFGVRGLRASAAQPSRHVRPAAGLAGAAGGRSFPQLRPAVGGDGILPAGPTQSPPSTHHQDEHLRARGEAGIQRLLAGGGGVILGRAAAVALGKDRGFDVRLDGPADRRVGQGGAIEGISEAQARERLCAADKARTAYVRRLYRCDPADASLYHLVLDSTAIP